MKKRMGKKGAIELSMNTIVVVVIGITLLVLGLVFVRGIFQRLGVIGTKAFEAGEQELKLIQAGESKINFLASAEVKKGGSSNQQLKICNTDGVLSGKDVYLIAEGSDIYKGLSVKIGDMTVSDTALKPAAKNLGKVEYQYCYPIPVLITAQPNTVVDPSKQPFLTLTVRESNPSSGSIYDSIGTTITVK